MDLGLPLLKRGPKETYQRIGGEGVAGAIFRGEVLMSSRKGQQRSRLLSRWDTSTERWDVLPVAD